jgi:hypothetical protein
MMLEDGLAQAHFRWPRLRREALSAAAPWLAACVLPTLFVLRLLLLRGPPAPIDTVGRLLLALSAIGLAVVAWRLFAPGRIWTVRGTVLAEPLRVRQAVRIAMSGGFVLMSGLVLNGYLRHRGDAEPARHRVAGRAAADRHGEWIGRALARSSVSAGWRSSASNRSRNPPKSNAIVTTPAPDRSPNRRRSRWRRSASRRAGCCAG